ncbi:MAG: hypothetical protein ACEQSA_01010 [Weeksellaceae bacterium]
MKPQIQRVRRLQKGKLTAKQQILIAIVAGVFFLFLGWIASLF